MNSQRYIATFIFSLLFCAVIAQTVENEPRTASELPKVFLIGEYESFYSSLYEEYPGILLHQTENDMDKAFEKWLMVLHAMEVHSEKIDYDIKGLKVWLQIFFEESGEIDHILFFKKPLSKNIDDQELIAFFRSFIKDYVLPIEATENFNHSGSASFPTYGHAPLEARREE
ncbi:hypothetical protein KUV50_06160 [Membranicola marinus]|uniref:Uncharacterized protein n=1 Tax=Membranihabitans marinus TaxID=1227546 RepID=A0A953LCF0_9BACT|nr:hypothetical protein [Membranihabitans marinus]MBY5957704.1 hypothetical protein [Membranihabitans marinus]